MSKRTPDQYFALYVKTALIVFAVIFSYFIVADLYMPVTPQARVYHPVTQITPRVSGEVTHVFVTNNQQVHKGDLLMRIDDRAYKLAVTEAKLALSEAKRSNQQIDADIDALNADLQAAQAQYAEQQALNKRAQALLTKNAISQQEFDQINASLATAKAQVSAINAKIAAAKIKRGEADEQNLSLQQARNLLEQAKLNLAYTEITAPHDGTISNLQVSAGTFAKSGIALSGLVDKQLDIAADFREKSLYHVQSGDHASVVFDALPGHVFTATVGEFEAGVSDGQLNADGTLAQVETSNRWVRDAQRQRVHITLTQTDNQRLHQLASGARATVQIVPNEPISGFFARAQIHAISMLHYIY